MTVVLAVTFLMTHPGTAQGPNGLEQHYRTFVEQFANRSFSTVAFKEALITAGLPEQHIDEIVSHARRESGNFNSRLFRQQHNAFGMRLAKRRTTTALGAKRGYATYQAWYDSVYDYWLWYKKKPIKPNQSWTSYLRSRKYTNPKDRS